MGGWGRPSHVLTVAGWSSSSPGVVQSLLSLDTAGDVGPVPSHSAHLLKYTVQSDEDSQSLQSQTDQRSAGRYSHQHTGSGLVYLPSGDVFMAQTRLGQARPGV